MNQLELGYRPVKLDPLQRILEGSFVCTDCTPSSYPRYQHSGGLEDTVSTGRKIVCMGELVPLRYEHILKPHIPILSHPKRILPLHLFSSQPRTFLSFHHKALHFILIKWIPRPHVDVISVRGIADPPFLAVEEVAVGDFGRGGL